jgi:CcmD family protein
VYEFLEQNSLYVVLLIVLIGWVGIFFYLLRLDKKLKKLEKMLKEQKDV